ncbi:MAG: hypothetical protein ABSD67_15040 [Terracidiphilus sp.]|jgi:hypothetical protein
MSTELLDAVSKGPATRYTQERQGALLAAMVEELANLRFSIVLTAKWEMSSTADAERRNEWRVELKGLRRHYDKKIDEIAMTFGVQNAMKAQENVERTIAVPLGLTPPAAPSDDTELYF